MLARVLSLIAIAQAAAFAQPFVELERFLLVRALRAEYLAASRSGGKAPESLRKAANALGLRDAAKARWAALASLAELRGIALSEAQLAAAAFRFQVTEPVVEPNANYHVLVERVDPAAPVPALRLAARVEVRSESGQVVWKSKLRALEDLLVMETAFPAPAQAGSYSVVFSILGAEGDSAVAEGRNSLWVINGLRARLAALKERIEKGLLRRQDSASMIWLSSAAGVVEMYGAGWAAPVRSGWQLASPVTQMMVAPPALEPLDPPGDLQWVESIISVVETGKDPVSPGSGWMPFTIRLGSDQRIRSARIWWPEEKPSGIVLLLGDGLAHERSWLDTNPGGPFLCLAFSSIQQADWAVISDAIAALSLAAGADRLPLYLFMHGNGARDGLNKVEKESGMFQAIAALAPVSDRPLASISLPPETPPLLLLEAGGDEYVAAEDLRRGGAALGRRLSKFDYAVLPGVKHDEARIPALPRAIEFFAAAAAGQWKPSGAPPPAPPLRAP